MGAGIGEGGGLAFLSSAESQHKMMLKANMRNAKTVRLIDIVIVCYSPMRLINLHL